MRTVDTFIATIYVGAKEGYQGIIHTYNEAKKLCEDYCDDNGLCITLTNTEFIYTDSNEIGFIIGLINYPRFPFTPEQLTIKAIAIAKLFKKEFKQFRVSIVCSDKTYMLEDDD
jgi:hypothetical protein